MSQLTTHILDTAKGKPAAGVSVSLFSPQNEDWKKIAGGITNSDGRIPDLLGEKETLAPGVYKLHFDVKEYFEKEKISTLYPFVEIVFTVSGPEHYHIPLLLNPFGYTTYRGS